MGGKKGKNKKRKYRTDFLKKRLPYLWRAITAVLILFTLYIVGRSCLSIVASFIEIGRLNSQKAEYMRSIEADSAIIERLKYDEYLEEYARENYHMQRRNEQVYIIEK